jgi:hypothetical protein
LAKPVLSHAAINSSLEDKVTNMRDTIMEERERERERERWERDVEKDDKR